jgi:DNA-3-methyladenine glycosylase II
MVGRIIVSLDCVAEGAAWLSAHEPRFAHALTLVGDLPLRRNADGFTALLDAILGQQVSVASARAIRAKMEAAGYMSQSGVDAATDEDLRGAGLSRQKARYAKALAGSGIDFIALRRKADVDVVTELVAVPGIGAWTAEIYATCRLIIAPCENPTKTRSFGNKPSSAKL